MFAKVQRLCKFLYRRCAAYLLICIYCSLLLIALFNYKPRCKYNMQKVYQNEKPGSKMCFVDTSTLGLTTLNVLDSPAMVNVERENFQVKTGGRWSPEDCISLQKVAVIIPYRDRLSHLTILLQRLHTMLRKQKLSYGIFVLEQAGSGPFNSGLLQNAGVLESLNVDDYDCFVLHDVDLIPEHDGNLYMCDDQLRHLASAIDEMRYHVMYYNSVGGVAAVSHKNLLLMNGHNNDYWGWGNEDDDFAARSEAAGLLITRPPEYIGRYKMIRHPKRWREDDRYSQFLTWRSKWKKDGLNTAASKYKVVSLTENKLYTNVTVDLGPAPDQPPNEDDLPHESLGWLLKFFFP